MFHFTLPVFKDLQKELFWIQSANLDHLALKGGSFGKFGVSKAGKPHSLLL